MALSWNRIVPMNRTLLWFIVAAILVVGFML
jgi:hypothetical protein